MANRKNKRAYLDDFQRDLNGNYQYCGAHCHYVGKTPRKTVLLRLWLLCGGAAALAAGAGFGRRSFFRRYSARRDSAWARLSPAALSSVSLGLYPEEAMS